MTGNELLQKFTFDAANQMDRAICYVDGVRKKATYSSNGLGKRVAQSTYEGKTGSLVEEHEDTLNPMKKIQYTLDLTRDYYNLLGQEDALEKKSQRFIWDGNVAGMEQANVDSYYMQDDLGSVLNLAGNNGDSLEALAYDEFGQVRNIRAGRLVQPFLFTGYQLDETSGLYFAQARRYDAGAGRFVSEDRVRGFVDMPVTLNHYGYCWNRPRDTVDLNGEFPTIVVCAIIGGVVGGVGSIVSDVYKGEKIDWKKAGKNTVKGVVAGTIVGTGVGVVSTLATAAGASTTTAVAGYATTTAINGVVSGVGNAMFNDGDKYSNFVNGVTGGIVANFVAYTGGKYLGLYKMPGAVNVANSLGGMTGSIVTDIFNNWDNGNKKPVDKIARDAIISAIITGFMGFKGQNFLTPFDNEYGVDMLSNLFLAYNYGVYGEMGTTLTYAISCICERSEKE